MHNIFGFTKEMLEEYFRGINENPAKARIIFEWIYKGCEPQIRASLIEKIKADLSFELPEIIRKNEDETAVKYLFRLYDGNTVEAVVMRHDYGNGICLSTQVGCNMGCVFCESGRFKKRRDLEAFEIVGQLIAVRRDLCEPVSHAVLMGIGEPLDNFDNSVRFINIATDPHGISLGARHITLSTCGIVPKIKDFFIQKCPACLAISLHAPNDELRSRIMPINRAYPLTELINTLKEYSVNSNKRITFEYMLLKDINCSLSHADELISLLDGMNCYVNLIPYNETSNPDFKRCSESEVLAFYDRLKKGGLWVTIRREFGSNIKAACGQLRNECMEAEKTQINDIR